MKLFVIEENKIKLDINTVEYLVNGKERGKTITRIRYLIANLFNCNAYPNVDLFGIMRGADSDHAELAVNIIEFMGLRYGDACFMLINNLAPEIIENYKIKSPRDEN